MDDAASLSTFDIAEYYQLHVGIEQTRVAELLFQPSMIGVDQGGLTETLSYVLTKYPLETQDVLSRMRLNIWLTYGLCSITITALLLTVSCVTHPCAADSQFQLLILMDQKCF